MHQQFCEASKKQASPGPGNVSMAEAFVNAEVTSRPSEDGGDGHPLPPERQLSRTLSNQDGMGTIDPDWVNPTAAEGQDEGPLPPERQLSRTTSAVDSIAGKDLEWVAANEANTGGGEGRRVGDRMK